MVRSIEKTNLGRKTMSDKEDKRRKTKKRPISKQNGNSEFK